MKFFLCICMACLACGANAFSHVQVKDTSKVDLSIKRTNANDKVAATDNFIAVDNSDKVQTPKEITTGFLEVQGKNIPYYNLRQKNELVALFTPFGLKEGAAGHYYISRYNEVTKGWCGNKLYDQKNQVVINLETFYSSD